MTHVILDYQVEDDPISKLTVNFTLICVSKLMEKLKRSIQLGKIYILKKS